MERKKMNCWEFKKCGRESGGGNVTPYGVCPAAIDERADGIHGGKNGGRCCWVVASRYNGVEGTYGCFAGGLHECYECDFYNIVKDTSELIFTL